MFGPLLLLLRSFNLGLQATDHPDPAALQKVQAAEPGAVDPLTGEPTYRVRPADDAPKYPRFSGFVLHGFLVWKTEAMPAGLRKTRPGIRFPPAQKAAHFRLI